MKKLMFKLVKYQRKKIKQLWVVYMKVQLTTQILRAVCSLIKSKGPVQLVHRLNNLITQVFRAMEKIKTIQLMSQLEI